MANYTFVADSSFQPLSMQEMLTPFLAYKDAFEKTEAAYDELNKADTFKYLSENLPDGSKARKIYEGYAGELRKQAEDLAQNGLSMENRRALLSLKRRYNGEIGRLVKADEALSEERKLRRSINAQDPSRLYAEDNLDIDSFLDNGAPNLYSISGNELEAKGAELGKAASSRIYSFGDRGSTLGGYYRDLMQANGYSPELMNKFYEDVASIPELQKGIESIMNATGASQNLTGVNRDRAVQSIINGMMKGAIYQEVHNPQRDLGVLTAAEKKQLEMQERSQKINLAMQGYTYDDKTNTITYDPNKDATMQKAATIAKIKAAAKGESSSKTSAYNTRNKNTVMVGASTGTLYKGENDDKGVGTKIKLENNARALNQFEYAALVDGYGNITNDYVRSAIGNGNLSDYKISIIPKGAPTPGAFSDDTTEDIYVVEPRESKRAATESNISSSNTEEESSEDTNDVPE